MDLLPSLRSIQKYLSRNLPEAITSRVRCLANEERRIGEVSWSSISAADFQAVYEERLRSNQLTIEFKAVEKTDVIYPQEIASLPSNHAKNAHRVLPYDHNRIIMKTSAGSQQNVDDYVNASLVEGYDDKTYIAAQGPVAGTVNDFWHMVWQQGSEVVVMLTDLFSYSKQQCEKYWHNTYYLYGDVHVRQDYVTNTCHYSFRRFYISKVGHNERAVDHWLFHGWDEHETADVSAILELRRKVKTSAASKDFPVIIHCSDGSGRTGTFIALDMILDKLDCEGVVDIINTVRSLRTFRHKMVSNANQYQFLYKAISMYLQCGTTAISVYSLQSTVEEMASGCETTIEPNLIERELEILTRIVPKIKVSDCAAGHRAENHSKSRDIMVQPPERARPYLMTFDSTDNSDYFNAVYINGHRHPNELIVTQWPLRCTVNDLWRLVYDCHVSTVVVLHDDSPSQEYPKFWPDVRGTKQRFGPIASTFLGSEIVDNLTLKSFLVKKAILSPNDVSAYGNETKQVKMIFLNKGAWPDSQEMPAPTQVACGVASRSGLLVDLLLTVRSRQDSASSILVVSRDGISRAGIFCAACIVYERLLDEDEVDIFSTVRSIKENRPQLVGTLAEYTYCYTLAIDLSSAYIATMRSLGPTSHCTTQKNSEHCAKMKASNHRLPNIEHAHAAPGPPLCIQRNDTGAKVEADQNDACSHPLKTGTSTSDSEDWGCLYVDSLTQQAHWCSNSASVMPRDICPLDFQQQRCSLHSQASPAVCVLNVAVASDAEHALPCTLHGHIHTGDTCPGQCGAKGERSHSSLPGISQCGNIRSETATNDPNDGAAISVHLHSLEMPNGQIRCSREVKKLMTT